MQNKATVFFKGGKKVYTFPFPYLSKQFVKARWDKTNSSVLLEYNRDYTIEGQNLTLVQEGSAEDTLCIYRQTPTDSLVDFNDGSILLASELDKMSVQLLHVAEEQNDSIHLSGMFAEDDAWQARGFRIKNLGNPVEPTDAVTLDYLNSIGVAHVDELQRIEKHIEHVAEEVKQSQTITNIYSDAAFESATEAKERAQWAKDAANKVLDETIRNRAIQDEITKQKRAVDEKADEARDFRDEAEAAAATAQQAAQGANTSANSASASAAAAAESAKKAAASAGFEGLVTTDIIKDGAVTRPKLAPDILQLLDMPKSKIITGADLAEGIIEKKHLHQRMLEELDTLNLKIHQAYQYAGGGLRPNASPQINTTEMEKRYSATFQNDIWCPGMAPLQTMLFWLRTPIASTQRLVIEICYKQANIPFSTYFVIDQWLLLQFYRWKREKAFLHIFSHSSGASLYIGTEVMAQAEAQTAGLPRDSWDYQLPIIYKGSTAAQAFGGIKEIYNAESPILGR